MNTNSSSPSRRDVNTSGAVRARAAAVPAASIWTRIERLVTDLRRHGVDVSTSEVLDVATGIGHIDIGDRAELRTLLRACLIKQAHHVSLFDRLFDRHLPARGPRLRRADDTARPDEVAPPDASRATADLDERLERSIMGSGPVAADLVASVVDRHAGLGDGCRGERYHLQRTLRAIDLARLLATAMRRARANGTDVDRDTLDAGVERLQARLLDEIRLRIADDLALDTSPPDLESITLVDATGAELEAVRAAIRPLARRLAARLRRRRSLTARHVDMRRTIRRSLSSGGVPIDPVHRRPRPRGPELFVVCDVSGSVAEFSAFTLTLISALSDEFEATRSFAFVDAIDEITDVLRGATGVIEPWQLLQSGRALGDTGHSDYGTVLESFWRDHGAALSSRSTVIVVGDARGNHRAVRADAVERIAHRAHRLFWLNPEPRRSWDTTDSTQSAYAEHCTAVFETRTLRQLADAVIAMC